MTPIMAGVGSPRVIRLRVCAIGRSVANSGQPLLPANAHLPKPNSPRSRPHTLTELTGRPPLEDVRPFRYLTPHHPAFHTRVPPPPPPPKTPANPLSLPPKIDQFVI